MDGQGRVWYPDEIAALEEQAKADGPARKQFKKLFPVTEAEALMLENMNHDQRRAWYAQHKKERRSWARPAGKGTP